ncbi:MAG: (2Fe-2S)-binding protein [Candidatus Hodarchaeota archaeon]
MEIKITINGFKKSLLIEPHELLIDVLRQEGYLGVKRGCNEGTCGACTIILNGKAVKSCILLAAQANNGIVTTIEGIGTRQEPHPLQQAFVDEGVVQCGFCIPGMILSAKALLDENQSPTKKEVKLALDGNLCRCTGYSGQIKAVLDAAEVLRGDHE